MDARPDAIGIDWLAACRRAGENVRALLHARPTSAERVLETGTTGEGGDRTLVIDAAAEEAVFAELERLYADGHRFSATSEERGTVSYGDDRIRVVIDPIDGSLNAKRGLNHYALSIAVADGPTMADVRFGYVLDFGADEEWWARSGGGAFLNGDPIEAPGERRTDDGRVEIVALESASPQALAVAVGELVPITRRVRAIGSIAISLCQLAATRVDGMASLRSCRGVDAAAAQLVVRESGGLVAFPAMAEPLAAPLGVEADSPVIAARTPDALASLVGVVMPGV